MVLDDLEFDEVILKYVMVLDTLMTFFNEIMFGCPKLKSDLYHHIYSDTQ